MNRDHRKDETFGYITVCKADANFFLVYFKGVSFGPKGKLDPLTGPA